MNKEQLKELILDAKTIEEAREAGIHCEHLEQRFKEKLQTDFKPLEIRPTNILFTLKK